MSIRKPNGPNMSKTTRTVTAGDLLAMNWAEDYVYITTAGVVRTAARMWASRNDEPLGTFADWFKVLSDTAPVTVHGYNGSGIWDVRKV